MLAVSNSLYQTLNFEGFLRYVRRLNDYRDIRGLFLITSKFHYQPHRQMADYSCGKILIILRGKIDHQNLIVILEVQI